MPGEGSGTGDLCAVPERPAGRRISPTMISQFVRLDQCRRYLRLALHERTAGQNFLLDFDVAPQQIPPLLTKAGAAFEAAVEQAASAAFPIHKFGVGPNASHRPPDAAQLIAAARELPAGEVLILFQPRIRVSVAGWDITGDADIVRLERDGHGTLRVLVADMKSSRATKVEHRLQVAFYQEMLERLLAEAGVEHAGVETGILYAGGEDVAGGDDEEAARIAAEREEARRLFGSDDAQLELTADPEAYRDTVRAFVTGPGSIAAVTSAEPFAALPWHLNYKCDGCLYNEFCMKWAADHDDISLLPYLSEQDKAALRRQGITTTTELVALKVPARDPETGQPRPRDLIPAPGQERQVERISRSWPVGPRLDEIVHRARAYRRSAGDDVASLSYIPSKGYGSLPYSGPDQNPNLVRIYIDAQHDYLTDRIYLIGALVTGNEAGLPSAERRRTLVEMTAGPPDGEAEADLLRRWVKGTIQAVAEVAAPDDEGALRAPIHLIFFNRYEQRLLLEALSRHARDILEATPLYDFITQLAAFDSPVATFLDQEIRELKNYPMVCQSLQSVAGWVRIDGRRFDWNEGTAYREIFRERLFDAMGVRREDVENAADRLPWYTRRARFSSQLPLEYAYQAWGALEPPPATGRDPYAGYRRATSELIEGFQARRLEALEHITRDFAGNKDTAKSAFVIPDLPTFDGKAGGLAEALHEFVTIERHVELAAWKSARLPPPERRVLAGDTLLVRYHESEQLAGVAETYRENLRRAELKEAQKQAYFAANPEKGQAKLTPEEKLLSDPLPITEPFRLRIDVRDAGISLDDALRLSSLKDGQQIVIAPRWMQDGRLPVEQRVDLTPTAKALLYRMRMKIEEIEIDRDSDGRAATAWLLLRPAQHMESDDPPGFLFQGHNEELVEGKLYTIDDDPNDIYGFWGAKVVQGLLAGGQNTLFTRVNEGGGKVAWPEAVRLGQARFMAGLQALHEAGSGVAFEPSKAAFVGERGDAPLLLVQGPPGTGKSFTTALAILARVQGAMAAGMPFRVVAGAKTHAATDVLLKALVSWRGHLAEMQRVRPEIFAAYFDARLVELPLYRLQPREAPVEGVVPISVRKGRGKGTPRALERVASEQYCVVASTPGGVYRAAKEMPRGIFGNQLTELLVLDEASQLSLPESIMAALTLKPDGQIIIVGDHRQMAPIIKHDWENESRRTFEDYAVYRSLFDTVMSSRPAMIQFEESFRLDRDMAEFLRRTIYAQDDLAYHSRQEGRLREHAHGDPFVAAALDPDYPLVVIVHDEAESQLRNDFERRLTTPLLAALYEAGYAVDDGFGLVVPHRAQRANLQDALRATIGLDGGVDQEEILRAVDTVERFQGAERDAIIYSATESDPAYLLAAGGFLFDPRRLTVSISRARDKMILVASRSVFDLFSPDETIFANAQLWKDLLYRACTVPLWDGEIGEHHVAVWGNSPLAARDQSPVATSG